jgi:hypothetical protein
MADACALLAKDCSRSQLHGLAGREQSATFRIRQGCQQQVLATNGIAWKPSLRNCARTSCYRIHTGIERYLASVIRSSEHTARTRRLTPRNSRMFAMTRKPQLDPCQSPGFCSAAANRQFQRPRGIRSTLPGSQMEARSCRTANSPRPLPGTGVPTAPHGPRVILSSERIFHRQEPTSLFAGNAQISIAAAIARPPRANVRSVTAVVFGG